MPVADKGKPLVAADLLGWAKSRGHGMQGPFGMYARSLVLELSEQQVPMPRPRDLARIGHRRRHVYRAGIGVPVFKMTASAEGFRPVPYWL